MSKILLAPGVYATDEEVKSRKYKFVRIVDSKVYGDQGDWYLVPQSHDDIEEHHWTYIASLFNAAQRHQMKIWRRTVSDKAGGMKDELVKKAMEPELEQNPLYNEKFADEIFTEGIPQYVVNVSKMIVRYSRALFLSRLHAGAKLMSDRLAAVEKMFNRGDKIYLSDKMIHAFIINNSNKDTCKIVEEKEVESKQMIYPTVSKPTIKDVRIFSWDNGVHYYAKIFNLDIVWDNEQKWNTYAEAEEAAKEFIKDLWG